MMSGRYGMTGCKDAEAVAEIILECDTEFGSGAHQSEERATVATIDTASSATDLAFSDMKADIALGVWSGMVRRRKMGSKRVRSSPRRRAVGSVRYALRSS
jgi:hypothetical protein